MPTATAAKIAADQARADALQSQLGTVTGDSQEAVTIEGAMELAESEMEQDESDENDSVAVLQALMPIVADVLTVVLAQQKTFGAKGYDVKASNAALQAYYTGLVALAKQYPSQSDVLGQISIPTLQAAVKP